MKKIICITGATSGIGKATAEEFAQSGYDLILCGRRQDRLQTLAEKLHREFNTAIQALVLDVRDQKKVEQSFRELPDEWKSIDILVNNAGLAAGIAPLTEGLIDDWDQMIDTNVKGLLYVTREVARGMKERGQGHIINIGSIAGKETYINGNVYCATKHAVDSLTKALRIELLPYGIKVTQIAPGAVETEFSLVRLKGNEQAAKNVYKGYDPLMAEDIAEAILFVATRKPHVCINDLLIMPTAQANTVHWHKEN